MALSIKTAEADRLARDLARLTGETMTEVVTEALRQRLAREKSRRAGEADLPARLDSFARRISRDYDTLPVTRVEWDEASGDME
jgi:antitoxin VapB